MIRVLQPRVTSILVLDHHLPTMSEDQSTLPPTSGAQLEPVEAPNASSTPSSPSVDMLALGFGVLRVDSNEDPSRQNEVFGRLHFALLLLVVTT